MTETRNEKDYFGKGIGDEMEQARASNPNARYFEIRVKGHLSDEWSEWLEGLEVELLDNGEMILSGAIVDQAALLGVLHKLYSLNLTLLAFSEVDQKK